MRRGFITILLSLMLVSLAIGGGFGIYEFGARASAMGGAAVANASDASTIFYNPGGLAFLDGTNFYGGVTLIFPSSKFVGASPYFSDQVYKSKSQVFPPVGIYVSHKFTDDLAAGIGLTNPFGLGLAWEDGDNFPGRAISKDTELQSFYVSPVVSYRLTPELSVGGGLDFVIATVNMNQNIFMFDNAYEVGAAKLEGTSKLSVGFSLGAMLRAGDFGLGAMYRHKIENKFEDSDAKFELYNNLSVPNVTAMAATVLKDQKVSTAIPFPNYFAVGAYYKATDDFGIEVDYMWYNWSVFKELKVDFEDDALDSTIPEEYENSIQIRVGAHYDLTDELQVRLGYIWDQTPQPVASVSPFLPDNNRNDYSFGLGYTYDNMQFDLGYMVVDSGERTTVEGGQGKNDLGFDGTYTSIAHLFFFSFGYTLD